jgi:hypothetical protein
MNKAKLEKELGIAYALLIWVSALTLPVSLAVYVLCLKGGHVWR